MEPEPLYIGPVGQRILTVLNGGAATEKELARRCQTTSSDALFGINLFSLDWQGLVTREAGVVWLTEEGKDCRKEG